MDYELLTPQDRQRIAQDHQRQLETEHFLATLDGKPPQALADLEARRDRAKAAKEAAGADARR